MSEVVASRLGLHFPPPKWKDLERGLDAAARELGLPDAAACAARLLRGTPDRAELHAIAAHLTVGETYFFRDAAVFDALRATIVPQLVQARRGRTQRLRFWSAACCTGEEPYSLAIMLRESFPDLAGWHVTILGTDLNPRFLQKAAAGVYGEWSFRGLPESFRKRHFRAAGAGRYALRPEIMRMVTFAQLNLVQDLFPSITSETNAMDLILCRNVLMYFTPEQMDRVVGALRQALVPGGWLAVAPSEASHVPFAGFERVALPGTLFHRRLAPSPAAAAGHPPSSIEAVAKAPLPASPPARARAPTTRPPGPPPRTAPPHAGRKAPPPDFAAMARARANEGALDDALGWCDRWVAADKLNAAAHYLRAMVLLEKGDAAQAALALQRTVFLDPGHAMAQVAWGHLAHAQGDEAEARRHFRNALAIVARMPADAPVADADGLAAGRLAETLAALAPP